MLTEEFGKRLKYWREKRGLSGNQLSKISGLSKATISNYENGNRYPSIFSFEILLEALDVSIAEFFEVKIC